MKDRILNTLLLITVAAALVLTLLHGTPETKETALPLTQAALPSSTAAPDPVENFRQQRKETRQQEYQELAALAENGGLRPEIQTLAEEQLQALTARNETELAVEAALAAQGFSRALCVCREEAMTIFVPRTLTEREAALIMDLSMEISGMKRENIRISAC